MNNLPDVQELMEPNIKIPIQQVGVENIKLNFMLALRDGGMVQLPANASIRTNLSSEKKGISMSRLLLTLEPFLGQQLNHELMFLILSKINENVGSTKSYLKFEFELPIMKKSILSNNSFPLYHKCFFEAQNGDELKFFQGIRLQYASYCPCSAELSKDLVESGKCDSPGFPHAQRSYTDILIRGNLLTGNSPWLEDIIDLVYDAIKTQPYPIIKRIDEQEIARIASQNPLFVEDAIREISNKLNNQVNIIDWLVKCSHEESIHTHEAIALNWKGVEGGFTGDYKL